MVAMLLEIFGLIFAWWLLAAGVSGALMYGALSGVLRGGRAGRRERLWLKTILSSLVISGLPLLFYGATADDTIGGLNGAATAAAMLVGVLGALAGAGGAFAPGARRFSLACALGGALLVAAGALVWQHRVAAGQFRAGYGP
jgi:hypothetical protein